MLLLIPKHCSALYRTNHCWLNTYKPKETQFPFSFFRKKAFSTDVYEKKNSKKKYYFVNYINTRVNVLVF